MSLKTHVAHCSAEVRIQQKVEGRVAVALAVQYEAHSSSTIRTGAD